MTIAVTPRSPAMSFEKAQQPKEWFEVPGATHHSLYDIDSDKAIPKLEEFFGRSL